MAAEEKIHTPGRGNINSGRAFLGHLVGGQKNGGSQLAQDISLQFNTHWMIENGQSIPDRMLLLILFIDARDTDPPVPCIRRLHR